MTKIWTKEEEAERLKARFEGVNQADFARKFEVPGGASMLSQHITGRRPMNMDAALAYMKGFGVRLDEISPRLAKVMYAALRQIDEVKAETAPVSTESAAARAEGNLALSLAVAFQEVASAPTADGRTPEELHDWLLTKIAAWPTVDPRRPARGAESTTAPSPSQKTQRGKGRAPRAAGSA